MSDNLYFYAELCCNGTYIKAHKNIPKKEYERCIRNFAKSVRNNNNKHTVIYGRMCDLKRYGLTGQTILNKAHEYTLKEGDN